jgi:hypothetical protein
VSKIREVLAPRIAGASLRGLAAADYLVADPALLAAERGAPEEADACAHDLQRALGAKNQFVASEPALAAGVRKALRALWEALGAAGAGASRAEALAAARVELAAIVGAALGPEPREIVSAEYSAELQLAVLGLDAGTLAEPILDVGCGENATLVRHLLAANKDARGVDWNAPEDVADRGNWLELDYGIARWGTILSHLGFSLHFMHQEMRRSDLAFEYARAYMRIVKALAPGGTFAYVPGLPFIEGLLPASAFDVKRVALPESHMTPAVRQTQRDTGLVLDAATHVRRLR